MGLNHGSPYWAMLVNMQFDEIFCFMDRLNFASSLLEVQMNK